MIINNIGKDLNAFGTRKLKRLLQNYKIWLDVNKNSIEDERGEPTDIRGQEVEFDKSWGLKHKLTKLRGLSENMKSFRALLGAEFIEVFGKTQCTTKIFPKTSSTRSLHKKINRAYQAQIQVFRKEKSGPKSSS